MSAGAGSLRDLYSSPPTSWTFIPPPTNGSSSSSNSSPPSEPSYQWNARPRPNSIYELSPDLSLEPTAPNAVALLRAAAASAVLQYFSSAVENPWEVGKTLLQVQHVPREATAIEYTEYVEAEDESSDESSAENEESYFADENEESSSQLRTPRQTDDRGYVVRRSVSDTATRPDWMLPLGSVEGVWAMMKEVGRWKPEGWLALWKGTATGCMKTFLESALQPIVHSLLSSLFANIYPVPGGFSRTHHILLPVASNLVTGFFLSPLDLIRTRLIVQTSSPHHRRYSGPFDALNQILLHEGGIKSIYLHPHLLYPTILDCTLTPLVAAGAPLAVARLFGPRVTEETHPLLWGLAQLLGACAGLIVTVPIETVRRRLQVQTRGSAAPLQTCVEVRRRPYMGIWNTMFSIISEERSDLPLKPRRKRHHRHGHERRASRSEKGKGKEGAEQIEEAEEEDSWLKSTGIGQLYRGLGMRVSASVIIFVLSMFSTDQSEGSAWTEL